MKIKLLTEKRFAKKGEEVELPSEVAVEYLEAGEAIPVVTKPEVEVRECLSQ